MMYGLSSDNRGGKGIVTEELLIVGVPVKLS